MRVSVIITAWNNTEYLEECLESVTSQDTSFDYEVLLGIDGCLKTLCFFESIKHKFPTVRCYYTNNNVGTYVLSNTLATLSRGDLILRFDSDDIMHSNMISLGVMAMVKNVSVARFRFISFGGKPHSADTLAHGVIIIRRCVFNYLGGFKPWRCAADTDLLKRAHLCRKKVIAIRRATFKRREHPNSLSKSIETGMDSALRHAYKSLLARKCETIEMITCKDYKVVA